MSELPPFVVINLDRDADRLAHMQREFTKLGLTFQRFPAVNGANLPEHLRVYFAPAESNPLSAGETGCYASHLAICRAIVPCICSWRRTPSASGCAAACPAPSTERSRAPASSTSPGRRGPVT